MAGDFQVVEFIAKVRDGVSPSPLEVKRFAQAILAGEVTDAQVAAWTMAVYFRSMAEEALFALTCAMAESGHQLDLSAIEGTKLDKHSTGGVGDKTTLVVAPLVASFGVPVIKLSGRALGHSGGTVDKLESIPGFRTDLSKEEIIAQGKELGLVLAGHHKRLAPLDAKIYHLRDSCGTVESIPLIASSIMSKKLASGADAFVFDVKVGHGAFMKSLDQAKELASLLVSIAEQAGKKAKVVYSSMAEPLGSAVGNSLEVREALACLEGKGPGDLEELVLALAEAMLSLAGIEATREDLAAKLASGEAKEKFLALVRRQGGDLGALPTAPFREPYPAERDGYVQGWQTREVGLIVRSLTVGNPAGGVEILAKRGSKVQKGEPVALIHAQSKEEIDWAKEVLAGCVALGDLEPQKIPLLLN